MGTCQLAIRSFSVDKARIYNCQQSQFPSLFFNLASSWQGDDVVCILAGMSQSDRPMTMEGDMVVVTMFQACDVFH
jgi:hypothetical protein